MLTDEEREDLVRYCSIDEAKLLARLQNMRKTGDYDDFIEWNQEDVEPLFEKVEGYINKIKVLVE